MKKTILLLTCILISSPLNAQQLDNKGALNNLTTVKSIFDINQGNTNSLLLRLDFVQKTFDQLKAAGVEPKFVLAFRGGASFFITKGTFHIVEADREAKKQVEERLKQFKKQGMVLEQCALAAQLRQIGPDEFLPEVTVVQNGYISMIGYQNQGYAFVPMD